jgi:anti-sigma B factor antagonist
MPLDKTIHNGLTVLSISGSIDSQTAPALQQRILVEVKDLDRVVVEMKGVDYMSSAGLRMLLMLYRQVTARRGRVTLVGVSEEIRDVMSHTGFLKFFEVADSLDQVGLDPLGLEPAGAKAEVVS